MASDALDIASFVLGVVTFLLGFSLKQLIVNCLPPARLKEIGEALAQACAHVRRLVSSGQILEREAASMLLINRPKNKVQKG
ncbi:hypothetical protein TRAPUB_3570 [Trametes pubescens]|uniref:Uncharacterized protein n=1 Tax=Trametes pubescens TaxID=154538 RepID=A0A1M2VDM9_TRAPU|nr:hypothetical protein TRAPUB_3570 [Trametes pubescens]